MKKFLVAISMVAVLCCGILFAGCGGNTEQYSETFEGAVSKDTYRSEEAAAEAFVDNELSGSAYYANYVSSEVSEELTEEQIDKLSIDEDLKPNVVSVKKIAVSYTKDNRVSSVDVAATISAGDDIQVFYIYVLEIAPDGSLEAIHEYRYYVPISRNGETLTKAYLDDVLAPSKYLNCTQTYSVTAVGSIPTGGYVIKVADDKASLKIDSNYAGATFSEGYFEQSGNSFHSYTKSKDSNTWQPSYIRVLSLGGETMIDSMEAFATMMLPNNIDYSWFEKTDFGFKMEGEFIDVYIQDALSQSGYDTSNGNITTDFNVYVKEGCIYKITTNIKFTLSLGFLSSNVVIQSETLSFSNFGTTVVERPADL